MTASLSNASSNPNYDCKLRLPVFSITFFKKQELGNGWQDQNFIQTKSDTALSSCAKLCKEVGNQGVKDAEGELHLCTSFEKEDPQVSLGHVAPHQN